MTLKKWSIGLLTLGVFFTSFSVSAQTSNPIAQSTEKNIPFQVCVEAKNWVRPSPAKQKEYLESFKRYSKKQVEKLGGDYWTNDIFAFINYPGGSGIFDINNLSGIWSLKDGEAIKNKQCTSISSIESKHKADIWLFTYKPMSIKWVSNSYVMVVKPIQKGIQVIHFDRKENQDKLPLTVVTESGKQVQVLKY
jgi:hypothetical protein